MPLTTLLRLQLLYALLGTTYNIVSIVMQHLGGPPLSATSPRSGVAVMAIYTLFLIAGYFRHLKTYKLLMTISVLILGYGGVVVHLLNIGELHLYQSPIAWAVAVSINFFGVYLNTKAMFGRYV